MVDHLMIFVNYFPCNLHETLINKYFNDILIFRKNIAINFANLNQKVE